MGDVVIDGNLVVRGTLTVGGVVSCRMLRTTEGLIRFGGDDGPETLDQMIYLQRACGSYDCQSALVQKPAGLKNGALFLQVPGDEIQHGTIAAQFIQYGPARPGNPRRQRLGMAVFVQSDGNPFATIDSTLSGAGDPQAVRAMPLLFTYDTYTAARLDERGLIHLAQSGEIVPDQSS
ncbi:MAG TPA: hypothetical protein VKB78_11760 [Pirellulales bacterium]|nr:hypothetical protein [Pirellulales bacterium]